MSVNHCRTDVPRSRSSFLRPLRFCGVALVLFALVCGPAFGVEIKLFDGARIAALVETYDSKTGLMTVYLTSGEGTAIPLSSIAAIYYSGRPDHFVRTGDQTFYFGAGGHICAAVESLEKGETLTIRSQSLGRHVIPLNALHGFTAMAVEGRAARLAEDLMRPDGIPDKPENAFLDHVLDRRGVPYAGVVESFTPVQLEFEHDEQLQDVKIGTFKLAGVRLAEAARDNTHSRPTVDLVHVGVFCRDRSCITGVLETVDPFEWRVRPSFAATSRRTGPSLTEVTGASVSAWRASK